MPGEDASSTPKVRKALLIAVAGVKGFAAPRQAHKDVLGLQSFRLDAGHGDQVICRHNTEPDLKDEVILTYTGKRIIDNVMKEHLVNPLPRGAKLFALWDCCHSHTVLDLEHDRCNTWRASFVDETLPSACHSVVPYSLPGIPSISDEETENAPWRLLQDIVAQSGTACCADDLQHHPSMGQQLRCHWVIVIWIRKHHYTRVAYCAQQIPQHSTPTHIHPEDDNRYMHFMQQQATHTSIALRPPEPSNKGQHDG